jgi:hypothetical protein
MSIIDLQRRIARLAPPDISAERDEEMDRIAARLTSDQLMTAARLRDRLDEAGYEGWTEQDHADADEIRAALLGLEGDQL